MKEILRLAKFMTAFLYFGLCYGTKAQRNNTNFDILDAVIAMSNETSPVFTKKTQKNYLISKNNKRHLESHRKETMIFSSLSDFTEILRAV